MIDSCLQRNGVSGNDVAGRGVDESRGVAVDFTGLGPHSLVDQDVTLSR